VHLIDFEQRSSERAKQRLGEVLRQASAAQRLGHIVYDPDAVCPIYAAVTQPTSMTSLPPRSCDRAGAPTCSTSAIMTTAGWAKLHAADCRIVTRLKSNTKPAVVRKNAVRRAQYSFRPHRPTCHKRMARNRQNPFQDPVREIRVRIDTGKSYASSPMTSIYRQLISPISINVVGRLSCSFVGSSRPSKSRTSLALENAVAHSGRSGPDRLPIAAAWHTPRSKPFTACSPSPVWCAQTLCTATDRPVAPFRRLRSSKISDS